MKIAVWKTGHEIADRVAESLAKGFNADVHQTTQGILPEHDKFLHIGYGILRGTGEIFKQAKHWFNVDRGYFSPSHYDGYYRISYRGTQVKYDASYPVKQSHWNLEPIQKYDRSKPWLICPPTEAVCDFYGIKRHQWTASYIAGLEKSYIIRQKGDQSPIPWDDISAVVTFNSSVGWQAVMRGIPCLSDTTHSVVGSYYNTNSLDEVIDLFHSMPREPMLDFMRAHQFTLAEIEQGRAWPLINHYLSSSDGMLEKPSPPMSPLTPFAVELKKNFQSAT